MSENTNPSRSNLTLDPWTDLRQHTQARIALGNAGGSLPTTAHLHFQASHAATKDAVWTALDEKALLKDLQVLSNTWNLASPIRVQSAALDRNTYLRRPDLGRELDEASSFALENLAQTCKETWDLCFVVADGLSAQAVSVNATKVLDETLALLRNWRIAPLVLASQARVALGDSIAKALRAKAVVILLGERPGLSAADSLGIYLSWAPIPGITKDDKRNCISNIRPSGMSPVQAASKLAWLLEKARVLQCSGLELKDEEITLPKPNSEKLPSQQ